MKQKRVFGILIEDMRNGMFVFSESLRRHFKVEKVEKKQVILREFIYGKNSRKDDGIWKMKPYEIEQEFFRISKNLFIPSL